MSKCGRNKKVAQHILTSSVIFCWTDSRQHGNYLFHRVKKLILNEVIYTSVLQQIISNNQSKCENKGWKFLKKLWCCVGGGNKVIWLYQLSWKCKLATVTSWKVPFCEGKRCIKFCISLKKIGWMLGTFPWWSTWVQVVWKGHKIYGVAFTSIGHSKTWCLNL